LFRTAKAWVSEGTGSDPDEMRQSLRLPENIRAASATEMKSDRKSACRLPLEALWRSLCDADMGALVEHGDAEGAPRSALAIQAMA
jgi:hypothetical protein